MRGTSKPTSGALARLIVATLLASVACLVAAGAASAQVPRNFFGTMAVQPTDEDFEQMAAGGIGSFRVGIGWRGAQPTRQPEYQWGGPDRTFAILAYYGITPVTMLFGTPRFIEREEGKIIPPVRNKRQLRQWERFVAAVVDRYGPNGAFWRQHPWLPARPIRDLLIWNEQNAYKNWRPRAQPGKYAALVRASRRGIDSANPSVRLITGGMYGYPQHARSMNAKRYLKRLYARKGMARAIDGVSLHTYSRTLKGVRRQVREARGVMRRAGDRSARTLIGEVGWASGGPRNQALVKTRRKQARLLRQSMKLFVANRDRWKLRGAMWYVWRDYGPDPHCPWCAKAGLVNQQGKPKPAWHAYRQLIANRTG